MTNPRALHRIQTPTEPRRSGFRAGDHLPMESPNVPSFQRSCFCSGLDPGTCSRIASASDRTGGWRIDELSPLKQFFPIASTSSNCLVPPALPAQSPSQARQSAHLTTLLPIVESPVLGFSRPCWSEGGVAGGPARSGGIEPPSLCRPVRHSGGGVVSPVWLWQPLWRLVG